jgi:hypothetical protein
MRHPIFKVFLYGGKPEELLSLRKDERMENVAWEASTVWSRKMGSSVVAYLSQATHSSMIVNSIIDWDSGSFV